MGEVPRSKLQSYISQTRVEKEENRSANSTSK